MTASDMTTTESNQGSDRQPFTVLDSQAMPLLRADVDTDQIIPAAYLKVTDRAGLAEGLFANWRYDAEGNPDPGFVLNDPRYADARILLAGDNFGCGSSREHAPWALLQHGFRAVISPRFADIFLGNSLTNGLLPVAVPEATVVRWGEAIETDPGLRLCIDLPRGIVRGPAGEEVAFTVDPFSRHCLLEGLDPMGYLLAQESAIADFEARRRGPRIDTVATAARVGQHFPVLAGGVA